MTHLLRACIASGQVDASQIEAHRAAGEIPLDPPREIFFRPAVPAGYALVPLEPTPEMLAAARRAPVPAVLMDSISAMADLTNLARYKAMLDAAPKPEGA